VTEDTLVVDLVDGRTITVPLTWYPRLAYGTPTERVRWRLIGEGEGIHWPDLDEDISIEGLLAGRRSGETQASLSPVARTSKSWLTPISPPLVAPRSSPSGRRMKKTRDRKK